MTTKYILKALVADDSDVTRSRILTLLSENPGVGVIGEAKDGLEASILTEKLKPDIVILDIRMPKKNGIETLKLIKKNDPPPIVIMLTNFPYQQYKKECKKAGADYFFDKSMEFDKIPIILDELLNAYKAKSVEKKRSR
ncbi:MAG: response regulator transcription factor [Candidatus Aminicenantes bacterium]|nr:response regulator transcription factor [Candidatus Aminicenantes bacterium]